MYWVKAAATRILDLVIFSAIIYAAGAFNAAEPYLSGLIIALAYRSYTGDGWKEFHKKHE